MNRKTFYFNEKKVFSTPDLAYSLHMEPFAGVTDVQDTILFVIGVMSFCDWGNELLAQVSFSDQYMPLSV